VATQPPLPPPTPNPSDDHVATMWLPGLFGAKVSVALLRWSLPFAGSISNNLHMLVVKQKNYKST
jgi:hypothetical protein